MSEKASYFKLGLFVIVASGVTLAGIAVLGAGAVFRTTIRAETYMDESVQGLDVGAPVKHRGVQIGKISRIAFVGEEYAVDARSNGEYDHLASFVYVEMELEVRRRGTDRTRETFKALVRNGIHARLASSGIVGTVYLDLYFPTEPVAGPELTWEPRSLYIPATKSMIAELTSTVSRLARQLEDARLDKVAQDLGRLAESVERKIDSLDVDRIQADALALLDEVRESNKRFKTILDAPAIETTLRNIADSSESIKRLTHDNEPDIARFVKDLPDISTRLKSSATEIETILKDERTRAMIDNLATTADLAPEAAAEIRRVAQRLGLLLRSQESDLVAIIQQLAKAADNLQRITDDAAMNPSRLLFGEPPPPTNPGRKEDR